MKCQKVLLAAAPLLIFGLPIFASLNSLAEDIRVIANPSVKADTISIAELKRVFLQEEITLADGTHVEPVIENGGSVHSAFRDHYLGISEDTCRITIARWCSQAEDSCQRRLGRTPRSLLMWLAPAARSDMWVTPAACRG